MRHCIRPEEVPEALVERGDEWTARWVERHAEGRQFDWPQYQNQGLHEMLLAPLLQMTQQRCAYCDGTLGGTSRETIDHFQPKAEYPQAAFTWSNLFAACDLCQSCKGSEWIEALLKPDAPGYEFSRYFYCDPETGTLDPNRAATPADQERARETIRILGLNKKKRPTLRAREWKRRKEALL